MLKFLKGTVVLSCFVLFLGCSKDRLNKEIQYPDLPESYNSSTDEIFDDKSWHYKIEDEELRGLINVALNNNFALEQLNYDTKIKEQELIATRSFLFPSLDASINGSNKGNFEESQSVEAISAQLNLSYTVDIWGKLSDSRKKANIDFLESKALYEEAKQQLIVDISLLYYEISEVNQLLDLYKKNEKNSQKYYELTNSRYKQGISSALDTYLAKDSVYNQQVKINNLQTQKAAIIYKLEQMLGDYPKGELDIKKELPVFLGITKLGIPSDLILRRASLNAAWNELLSADYHLAITHKQRLPALSLGVSLEDTKNDGAPLGWSLLGGLTAPIFSAGRLKANEEIAYLELKKVELSYLDKVYNTFVEIENFIISERNLQKEYEIIKKINSNAQRSLSLSFNEYYKGLVEYSTVLNLQESYYNSQASLIQTKRQLIQNKIQLNKALGGKFVVNDEEDLKKEKK